MILPAVPLYWIALFLPAKITSNYSSHILNKTSAISEYELFLKIQACALHKQTQSQLTTDIFFLLLRDFFFKRHYLAIMIDCKPKMYLHGALTPWFSHCQGLDDKLITPSY